MYVRIVECMVRPGKKDNFTEIMNGEVLNLLKQQEGFQDIIGLWSDREPNRAVAVSFWDSKEQADTYYQEDYQRVLGILTPLTAGLPKVTTYNVDVSTLHHITRGKAA